MSSCTLDFPLFGSLFQFLLQLCTLVCRVLLLLCIVVVVKGTLQGDSRLEQYVFKQISLAITLIPLPHLFLGRFASCLTLQNAPLLRVSLLVVDGKGRKD